MGMSRIEDILQAIIDGTNPPVIQNPQSREERLLLAVLEKINSGEGGSGTGLSIHICTENEYDSNTGVPTIENPSETTLYLVMTGFGEYDAYNEWVYVNNNWELFGSGSHVAASLVSMNDVAINSPQSGQVLVYNSETRKWINGGATATTTYTFSEGNVDGAFKVTSNDGREQTVTVHGLLPFCFSDNDQEIIFDSGSIDD